MEKIIDLHIHTNKSDGLFTPKEIIDIAKENNVSVISIADHDTIDAYNDELFSYAESKGIKLIPAVEISTKIDKCGIHVLGYNIDLNNEELKQKLYELRNIRHIYLYEVAAKLKKNGYFINIEGLDKIEAITKAHIAFDVITHEENKKLLIEKFGYIPSKGKFIETIMNEGCPAYVPKITINPVDAAKLIKKASGKVVLAHPVAYAHEDKLTDDEILNIIKQMKIDAIEANYIYVDKNENKIDETKHWMNFAKYNNLYYTVGSDFHNIDGIRPNIGLIGDLKLSQDIIDEILNYIEQ